MKKKIYLTFFIISLLITIFIYQKIIKDQNSEVDKIIEENSLTENSNNLIKNLKYNVNFENNSSYSITQESELINENNVEIIIMKNVEAIFTSSDNKIKDYLKNAKYNNLFSLSLKIR